MRVESSQLSFLSTHSLSTTDVVREVTVNRPVRATAAGDTVRLSRLASAAVASDREDLADLDPKQQVAILTLERLLGRKLRWYRARPGGNAPAQQDGRMVQRTAIHSEAEQTSFRASGTVEVAGGGSIHFEARLDMQRAEVSVERSTRSANATDPLIVNLGGGPARLTGGTIAFDLNADGTAEQVSFAAAGSGFLAIDRNGDGRVNDGRELFGPQSGDGFAELASYDSDSNGWIDEADPVFGELRIWTQNGLVTLPQGGIGALATAAVDTPFTIKGDDGNVLGQVRGSSVFLSEAGGAGTVQQVDLTARG